MCGVVLALFKLRCDFCRHCVDAVGDVATAAERSCASVHPVRVPYGNMAWVLCKRLLPATSLYVGNPSFAGKQQIQC